MRWPVLKDLVKILLGNVILTFAYAVLTVPNHIINGGVTSFSLIISQFIGFDVTVIANIFTLILLAVSFVFLGKSFVVKSLFSSMCYMGFLSLFHVLPIGISLHPLVCVMIAGIMVGIGYYLCISANASTVGFDVVALVLYKKNEKLNVAMVLRYISVIVLLLGMMSFGIWAVLYGILFSFIETETLNICMKLERKFVKSKLIKEEIAHPNWYGEGEKI